MVDVFAGLSGFKTMLDAAKALKGINDAVVRNEAVIDLQGQILTAQEDYAALLTKVRTLEAKVASFEKWEAEKERYELKDLGWGVLAYMLKPEARGTTPPHWVCPACFSDGKIKIIHQWFNGGIGTVTSCPTCKVELRPSEKAYENGEPKWLD